jgi:hypothetical protein
MNSHKDTSPERAFRFLQYVTHQLLSAEASAFVTYGYAATREAAMVAFAMSWRRE